MKSGKEKTKAGWPIDGPSMFDAVHQMQDSPSGEIYDVAVVGGGPAGATAAQELARLGYRVALVDKAGRIKPCGGAIPPCLVDEFAIPSRLLVATVQSARMVSPSNNQVDMPIEGGYVGMVDREKFDPWLRERAVAAGAEMITARTTAFERLGDGNIRVHYRLKQQTQTTSLTARALIGADGANSRVATQFVPGGDAIPYVAAYHEIVETPGGDFDGSRCDVWYQGRISPDFYGWVFPHGNQTSVGVGSANKGFSLKSAVETLRDSAGLTDAATIRCEGAPIPLKPLRRWDDGKNVLLAGDAAGIVAPASGEGIYYAMVGGRFAAEAVSGFLSTANVACLKQARKKFMRLHGKVFWVLGMMQKFWYASDRRRERFVSICRDPDVQHLTWQAYMHKKLVKARPVAHARIFIKDMAHLLGVVRP